MTYTLPTPSPITGEVAGVMRDGAYIPEDAGNRDWVAYLAWRAADPDNKPEPAEVVEPSSPESALHLTSPNGDRFVLTVSDGGSIEAVQVESPEMPTGD